MSSLQLSKYLKCPRSAFLQWLKPYLVLSARKNSYLKAPEVKKEVLRQILDIRFLRKIQVVSQWWRWHTFHLAKVHKFLNHHLWRCGGVSAWHGSWAPWWPRLGIYCLHHRSFLGFVWSSQRGTELASVQMVCAGPYLALDVGHRLETCLRNNPGNSWELTKSTACWNIPCPKNGLANPEQKSA